ncbi:MAG TPA: hypothetical protein VHN99_01160 [Deinococcales bacterium]|nr:hypothetical protein [Deinococcales bacterium]
MTEPLNASRIVTTGDSLSTQQIRWYYKTLLAARRRRDRDHRDLLGVVWQILNRHGVHDNATLRDLMEACRA